MRDPSQAIGIDLQMVGSGRRLLGKTQTSNFLTNAPVLFALPEPTGAAAAAIAVLLVLAARRRRDRAGRIDRWLREQGYDPIGWR